MENTALNKRKNYFIDKKFQSVFIIKFCALVIVGALISGAIVYMTSRASLTTTFESLRLVIRSTADFILPSVLLSTAVVIVVIGLASVAMTLFTSHRIAGPLYRMAKDIEEVSSGNLQKRFSLRSADEIKPLARGLDEMTQSLRRDIDELKRDAAGMEDAALPDEMKGKLRKIKETLSKFTT